MTILVLNYGSSSLKFDLVSDRSARMGEQGRGSNDTVRGSIERIGGRARLAVRRGESTQQREAPEVSDHGDGVRLVLESLNVPPPEPARTPRSGNPSIARSRIDAVGHRVVHGGTRFDRATLLDDEVIEAIAELGELAPLHNPAAVLGIREARRVLGPDVPMVAVFDTAFHHGLPPEAATYAIPHALAERHAIRRYGFHGFAHQHALEWLAEHTHSPIASTSLVSLHLGNGCSASAIREGRSVETSMGFTPLEGLVMGTRSGDIDPAIVGYLARKESVSVEEVQRWLEERSGLLGLSGFSHDMRDLIAARDEDQDERSRLAIKVFCHRARKYVGAYLAVIGNAQAIVVSGGIGENAPEIRSRIFERMEWCGLVLDPDRNRATVGIDGRITTDECRLPVYAVPSQEETIIAREVASVL